MIFTTKGQMYRLLVDKIPVGTNTTEGTPIKALVDMELDEKPSIIYSIYRDTDAQYLLFTTKWSNEGKTWYSRIDNKYSKNLTRKPSETIFYMLIAYYILICIVVIADIFIDNFMNDSIMALYVIAILCNYLGLVVVDKTMNEVVSLIETSGRGKKKIK